MSKLEVRMPVEERDRLREVASERGITVAELVRGQLAPILAVEERPAAEDHGPSAAGSRVAPEPSAETNGDIDPGAAGDDEQDEDVPVAAVNLAVWVSDAAGIPLSLARRKIVSGRVTVDGVPHLELEVPNPPTSVQLDGVELVSS